MTIYCPKCGKPKRWWQPQRPSVRVGGYVGGYGDGHDSEAVHDWCQYREDWAHIKYESRKERRRRLEERYGRPPQ